MVESCRRRYRGSRTARGKRRAAAFARNGIRCGSGSTVGGLHRICRPQPSPACGGASWGPRLLGRLEERDAWLQCRPMACAAATTVKVVWYSFAAPASMA